MTEEAISFNTPEIDALSDLAAVADMVRVSNIFVNKYSRRYYHERAVNAELLRESKKMALDLNQYQMQEIKLAQEIERLERKANDAVNEYAAKAIQYEATKQELDREKERRIHFEVAYGQLAGRIKSAYPDFEIGEMDETMAKNSSK